MNVPVDRRQARLFGLPRILFIDIRDLLQRAGEGRVMKSALPVLRALVAALALIAVAVFCRHG
nr:hypothetical protein [uncultured Holophaga sp.]